MVVSETTPYHCTIGLQLPASAATLCYDALISLLYTGIFVKYAAFPNAAQQTAHQASSLNIMAKRTIVATVVSLTTAAINYVTLIALDGQERGLLASSICSLVKKRSTSCITCLMTNSWITRRILPLLFALFIGVSSSPVSYIFYSLITHV